MNNSITIQNVRAISYTYQEGIGCYLFLTVEMSKDMKETVQLLEKFLSIYGNGQLLVLKLEEQKEV